MNDDTNRKTDPEILAEQPVPELDSDRINKRKSKKLERQEQAKEYARKRKKSRRRHRALVTFLTLLIGAAIGITTVYAATVLCAKKTANEPAQEPTVASVHPNADIALKFLKNQPEVENTVLSPLSIEYTLAMLRDGAAENSETRKQIEDLIGNRELPQYENIKKHISFANAIWIKEDFKDAIKPEFVAHLADAYGAEVKYDRFASTKNINKWVAERTFNMIDKVFEQFDDGAKIVLANTIAIDVLWEQEFRNISTSGQGFHLHKDDKDYHKDGDKANYVATTLNRGCNATIDENGCDDIKYAFLKDSTIFTKDLEKYGNTELEFVAVMPNDLKKYVASLTADRLNADVSAATAVKVDSDQYDFSVDYYLPRFSYKGGIDNFSKELYNLGIADAFDNEKAKFTNIYESSTPQDNLYVLDAAHKTFIGLDERGIRAAAITAIVGGMGAGGPHYIESHADLTISLNRPFLYLIRDKNSKDIWFIGTVYKPNKWENDCSAYGGDCDDEEYDEDDYDDDGDEDEEADEDED